MEKHHRKRRDDEMEEISECLREIKKRLAKRDRHRNSGEYEDDSSRASSCETRSSRTCSSRERSNRARARDSRSRRTRSVRTQSRKTRSRSRSSHGRNDSKQTQSKHASLSPASGSSTPIKASEGGSNGEVAPEAIIEILPANIENLLGDEGVLPNLAPTELHSSLATCWSSILSSGLNTETKQKILEKYSIPKNCNLLIPPKLNDEVAAVLNESGIKRDERIRKQQAVMGAAITSIGKVLSHLITLEGSENEVEMLSDSGRLLCDLYHDSSTTRRALILPGLNKDLKDLMDQTPIAEYLFGNKLQEKVNAAKAVKKSGFELKNTPAKPPSRPKYLNFQGPQRQVPRPSGQIVKPKRNTFKVMRSRRSPQRHHRRWGQDRH